MINLHTKGDVLISTISEDRTGPKIEKMDHVTLTTSILGNLLCLHWHLPVRNLKCVASAILKI